MQVLHDLVTSLLVATRNYMLMVDTNLYLDIFRWLGRLQVHEGCDLEKQTIKNIKTYLIVFTTEQYLQ